MAALLTSLAALVAACGGSDDPAPAATAVAPTITVQPAPATVDEGVAATFTVTASGTAPLAYQWRRNGSDIAGANLATYTLPATTVADSGAQFSVRVSNSAGSVTSSAAALNVNARLVPVTITAAPQSVTVAELQAVTVSVAASGTSPLIYQWQRSTDGATWTDIAGATNSSYTTTPLLRTDSGLQLRVVVNNAANQPATSAPAQLTVTPDAAVLLAAGGTVSGDNDNIRIEVPPGTLLGPTRFTFTPLAALPSLPADYELVPNTAYRIVHEGPGFVPNMPVAVIFRTAGTAPMTAQAVRGTSTDSRVIRQALPSGTSGYQLCPDGSDGTLVPLEDIQQGDAKGALVMCGNVTGSSPPSGNTTVGQVRPAPGVRPDITQQPVDVALTAPGNATFSVTATGRAPLAYQWQRNGTAIAGATSASYSLNAGAADSGARFSVIVSNAFGTVTSREATVVIGDGPLRGGVFATFDVTGNIYVTTLYGSVRKIAPNRLISTFAQLGPYSYPSAPAGVAVDGSGNVFVADDGPNVILRIAPSGAISTLAGADRGGVSGCYDATGYSGSLAYFASLSGLVLDGNGNVVVTDSACNNVRRITPQGEVSTFVGPVNDGTAGSIGSVDGTGSAARFNQPRGMAIDAVGNLYVADASNHTIRKITPQGAVSTLAGLAGSFGTADGVGDQARFRLPHGVTVDAAGNVYVTDFYTPRVRKITPSGVVSTLAGATANAAIVDGAGADARFRAPRSPFVDAQGNVYVLDYVDTQGGQTLIRKITPAGVVSTVF
jgi:sugar lactone lactonase YvrE